MNVEINVSPKLLPAMLNKCCRIPHNLEWYPSSIGTSRVHLFWPEWKGGEMEGRDIKRIILALVSLTCYAGPARPTRIYTVAATRCYVQKGTVIRLNP